MNNIEKFGNAIHQAVMYSKLPPNKRGTKQLRKQVKNVIKAMKLTALFDIVSTDDVIEQKNGRIVIRIPEDPRRTMAALRAAAYCTFFEHHPRNKKFAVKSGGKIKIFKR